MSNTTPRVTVILTTHNRPQYLPEAAQSILTQTLRELELLIVDDASTNPETAQIADQLADQDPRVRIIRRDQNGGPAAARNTGAAQARAPLITFMDDDDLCEPERLQKQAAFLDAHPHIASVACDITDIDHLGRSIRIRPHAHSDSHGLFNLEETDPYAGDFIWMNAASVTRRECFNAIDGYRECLRANEDFDISLRMQEKFKMALLPVPLYRQRAHKNARVSTSPHFQRMAIAVSISARRRRLGLPDPIENGELPDDAFLVKYFSELPSSNRSYSIRKFTGTSRRLLRSGKFVELRNLLILVSNLCTNTNERRKLLRIHLWIVWWSIIFGKPGFWFSKPKSV